MEDLKDLKIILKDLQHEWNKELMGKSFNLGFEHCKAMIEQRIDEKIKEYKKSNQNTFKRNS